MDGNPLGSSVHGILQARILEWVAISFSGDLPDPGVKPGSLALQADSLLSEPPRKPQSVPNAILNTLLTLIPLILTPDLRMNYSY